MPETWSVTNAPGAGGAARTGELCVQGDVLSLLPSRDESLGSVGANHALWWFIAMDLPLLAIIDRYATISKQHGKPKLSHHGTIG